MDMVTWTMKRQRLGVEAMKHNTGSLSMSLLRTDLGLDVPKQTYLRIKGGTPGSKSETIELSCVCLFR